MIELASIDTETTGTDTFHGCRPFLVVACDGKRNHLWEGEVNKQTREVYWAASSLTDLQVFIDNCKEIVFHNANFDRRMLESIGIKLPELVHDTMVASHVVCNGDVHDLKGLAIKYFGWFDDERKELEKAVQDMRNQLRSENPEDICFAQTGHPHFPAQDGVWQQDMWLFMELCKKYAFGDVERTYLLHKAFKTYLYDTNLYQQYDTRRRLLPVLYDMQTVGINFYTNKAKRVIAELERQCKQLIKLINTSAHSPYTIDPSKPNDLRLLLYTVLKLPVINSTDTGLASTDAATLKILGEEHEEIETIRYLTSWRKASKQLSDIKSYLSWCDDSGRIHSTIKPIGTKWTRNSSADPNQQSIDKKLAYLFGPPPGSYWWYADIVNIELRIWAYETNSQALIEAFESGKSVHMIIAEALYSSSIERLGEKAFKDTKQYTKCKGGTFARIYGGGRKKVDATYGVEGACDIIDERLPEVGLYFKQLDQQMQYNAEIFGYPCIFTMQGYRLNVPLSKPYSVPSARIQGTAGQVMQSMMAAIYKDSVYRATNSSFGNFGLPQCQMIRQVHDSITIEIPNHDYSIETNRYLANLMERVGCEVIPTCPMDWEVIECHQDVEPMFRDYTFIPRNINGYSIEMYMHNHQYFCEAVFDKDCIIKEYALTKEEAYEKVIKQIQGVPL